MSRTTKDAKQIYEQIHDLVRQIPPGKVATYGQIARVVGGCTPRMVGFAMAAVRGEDSVPWQRVLNVRGEVSARSAGDGAVRQRRLLKKEGVSFNRKNRVDFDEVGWLPRDPPRHR